MAQVQGLGLLLRGQCSRPGICGCSLGTWAAWGQLDRRAGRGGLAAPPTDGPPPARSRRRGFPEHILNEGVYQRWKKKLIM